MIVITDTQTRYYVLTLLSFFYFYFRIYGTSGHPWWKVFPSVFQPRDANKLPHQSTCTAILVFPPHMFHVDTITLIKQMYKHYSGTALMISICQVWSTHRSSERLPVTSILRLNIISWLGPEMFRVITSAGLWNQGIKISPKQENENIACRVRSLRKNWHTNRTH